ncbi:MAG: hypothetical protein ACP5G1_00405 [Nanopusillaceae archaeon]
MVYILNENNLRILEYIADKKEFTEKEVRRELKIKEEEIRKLLYILEEKGIIYPLNIINNNGKFDFRWGNKIPDKKKFFEKILKDEINNVEKELNNTPKTIYYCEECGIGYYHEEAYENLFKCKECGSVLKERENFRYAELLNRLENLKALYDKYVKTEEKKRVAKAKEK